MFKNLLLITVFSCVLLVSSQGNDCKEENVTLEKVIDSYSSVFHNQDKGCYCRQNFCECCEDVIENVCVSVGYYEVFDIPAAFGINVTINKEKLLSVTVNVTNLPCIRLPYVKSDMALCLQLYGFNKTAEYVRVLFDLKAKLVFSSVEVRLGCLLIPRLHPHIDTSKTVQYRDLLKRMGVNKASNDVNGLKFCSSPNSTAANSPKFIYLLLMMTLFHKILKY